MKPAPFVLHSPKTVSEAVAHLADIGEDGLVLAGGQSLVPMMALRVAYPSDLVDINGIEELQNISVENEELAIGATVRHARFYDPVEPGPLGRLLTSIVHHIAHHPIRERGTFCGSLAHADPASEWCLVAATLGAKLVLVSQTGERIVEAGEFIDGAMSTTREPTELLAQARLPLLAPSARAGFYEFNRRAGDFALGMALAAYDDDDGLMRNVRVGLGGIEDRAARNSAAEAVLEGQRPTQSLFADAGRAAAESVDPMEDATTSAEYRRDLTAVCVERALAAAAASSSAQTSR
ncbi:FAD binding domain-containing protein [Pseudohoeflea coraliihabitans]|uniref:FAD binding domain-containing protein n=1 Tax=Pseudohoeflea coraliihabitans TaxID=2860393 RepID=A0ABS6WMR7_9HYPH|nr:FAD binding domain-containing protein [Pseudohoeflea sp. DP4N28-3]MBW3097241.1 FAD binding domain-containing protein [Pseudohoeflea sp. DP4N28-3]